MSIKSITLTLISQVTTTILLTASVQAAPYHSDEAAIKAVEFAPGIISTPENFEINTVFNAQGDKVIFSRCNDDFSHCTLMESSYKQGQWQTAESLPFSGEFLDADPYYNQDFSQLYFISKRPISSDNLEADSLNLWRVALTNNGWQQPEYLADISSNAADLYPSITANGDLYFPSFRNDQRLMYVAKAQGEGFMAPQALSSTMHGSNGSIGDSAVSRDGKSIIFSIKGRSDSQGKGDLYISYLRDGQWSVAKSLGNKVNTADHEFTPIMSPDNNYLFFTRIENGKGNLYQVKLSTLNL
ncbi:MULTISPECIES: PD40 domain-containing protein [unclassified Shewanella]|uniref:TolB family protein n=1 Tax=unclassified Shewanella TaxID=196818 RepID=UPI000C817B90|nr:MULTISPECIES: PD40 domain-containing protein [unclassified Shewanella]MDO6776844.1 PD40 domain-containing protein [Shewanella sp. 3_MG-2023]PMG48935.1 hypothetical protein BCU91_02790 [Shewanella sp. 10N.286.52.B9]